MANISETNPNQYKKTEDRLTAALLQILHFGGHKLVSRIFEDIDLPSNEINIYPQVVEENSRPDGEISCNCNYKIYIESKIELNALKTKHGIEQLEAHFSLSNSNDSHYLVYITPDEGKPEELDSGQYSNIYWYNWNNICAKLRGYEDNDRLLDFLVSQFELLVGNIMKTKNKRIVENYNGITDYDPNVFENRVIIVGGSWAEPVALKHEIYACQEHRFFYPAKYIAFCFNQRIQYLFEIVGEPEECVDLHDVSFKDKDVYFIQTDCMYKGKRKVFHVKMIKEFNPVISNDKRDKNGNLCAFVYNQCYTTYDKIKIARKTSEL